MSKPYFVAAALPPDSACDCTVCRSMCARPGWPTPEEAFQMLAAGLAPRLMLDYWECFERVWVLAPAVHGSEGRVAPGWPDNGCVFQIGGGCTLHHTAFKPAECRKARCTGTPASLHQSIAALWDSADGEAVVSLWRESRKDRDVISVFRV